MGSAAQILEKPRHLQASLSKASLTVHGKEAMAFLHQLDPRLLPLLPRKLALALQLIFYAAFSGEGFQHAGKPMAPGNNTSLLLSSTLL